MNSSHTDTPPKHEKEDDKSSDVDFLMFDIDDDKSSDRMIIATILKM
jgi:hypothetical protein